MTKVSKEQDCLLIEVDHPRIGYTDKLYVPVTFNLTRWP